VAYDKLPLRVRRRNWGWFGEPWPSGVCFDYDDAGNAMLRETMRKPFPAGEICPECETEFEAGDSGQAMPYGDVVRHVHKECMLRIMVGPLAHHERRCHCFGGEGNDTPGMTRRQEAIAVWNWFHTRSGILPGLGSAWQ
jgi:hypothetical protein